jgi:hypothetical protein
MINKRHADLIHRMIDGELSAQDKIDLEHCLETSSAARVYHEQMVLLQRVGAERQEMAPPADLKSRVMDRVKQLQHHDRLVASPWSTWVKSIRSVFVPRFAYVMATGLILGFALGTMGILTGDDSAPAHGSLQYSGTLGLPSTVEDIQRIDSDSHVGHGLSVDLAVESSADQVVVRVRIQSESEAILHLSYAPEVAVIQAIERVRPSAATVRMTDGIVEISRATDNTFAVFFRFDDSVSEDIVLQVLAENDAYQHVIPIQR